ncbi:hypothetical protein F6W69_19035 [Microbacterium oxydans]|uniref:hypothetical protein n=1 Tax=Microbacterium oxydans TaxID=82380 RepID=UPI0011426119|nr:hypothetical protein [Microbacterium oxydans]KAB1888846.1 hypothetical protein F6W69_19035 [Microbacterium oxydans]GED40669.1 hypothetical protein MOX01_38110 [Microbacterium oxydans]
MTDITTTTEGTEVAEIVLTDNRRVAVGEIARAEEAANLARARVAELENEVRRLRTEQILDGGDPRLVSFWDKAGRIADYANFCEEYDRLADELNGVPREREWDVTLDVTLSLRLSFSRTARTSEDAIGIAEEGLDRDDVIEAIRANGWDDITFDSSEAERA